MNPSRAGFLSCPKTGTIPVTSTGGFTSLPRSHGHGLWPRCLYLDAHPPRRAREVFISKRERTPSKAPNSDLRCWGGQEEPETCRGLFLIVRCLWLVGAQWPFSFLKGLFTSRASVHSVRCPINRGRETVACQAWSQVWWLWLHVVGEPTALSPPEPGCQPPPGMCVACSGLNSWASWWGLWLPARQSGMLWCRQLVTVPAIVACASARDMACSYQVCANAGRTRITWMTLLYLAVIPHFLFLLYGFPPPIYSSFHDFKCPPHRPHPSSP